MIPSLWSSVFMGDVLADNNYSLTVYDPTFTNFDVITITKGSWWANAIVFWLWVEEQFNTVTPRFNLHVSKASTGIPTLALGGFYGMEIIGAGNLPWDVGMGQGSPLPMDGSYFEGEELTLDNAWITTFPIKEYTRASKIVDGVSVRAHSGKSFSIQGQMQGQRKLAVQLDRRPIGSQRIYEMERWRALWRGAWNKGRSVSFWLDAPEFIATEGSYIDDIVWGEGAGKLGRFEQLITVPDEKQAWRPKRLIECREFLDTDEVVTFCTKPLIQTSLGGTVDLYHIPSDATLVTGG